jgi:hypothetical protein
MLLHLRIIQSVGRQQTARPGLAGPGRERGINAADRVTHAGQFLLNRAALSIVRSTHSCALILPGQANGSVRPRQAAWHLLRDTGVERFVAVGHRAIVRHHQRSCRLSSRPQTRRAAGDASQPVLNAKRAACRLASHAWLRICGGWAFESLRMRPGHRPLSAPGEGFVPFGPCGTDRLRASNSEPGIARMDSAQMISATSSLASRSTPQSLQRRRCNSLAHHQ